MLKLYYSNTVRPTIFQLEIFGSFTLMLFKKQTSITVWANDLRCIALYDLSIVCYPRKTLSLDAHYDFISRSLLYGIKTYKRNLKILRPYKINPRKIKAPDKNKKLPNRYSGVMKKFSHFFEKDRSFSKISEKLLQKIFALVAV